METEKPVKQVQLKVKQLDRGLRLDQYIIKNLSLSLSRARIQRLIKGGQIQLNQKPVKAHYKVKAGDQLLINIPPAPATRVLAEAIGLEIVFEDQDLVVINKPAGMVTHPAVGNYSGTLVNALLHYGCTLSTVNGPLRPGIVHRLDKATSGLIVVAKNDFAHHQLARQFQTHTVKRKYLAAVQGKVQQSEGIIDLPIARDRQNRLKMTVSLINSKKAKTRYRVVKRYRQASLLELTPHTGRTHQLRVHLKFLGHPILGDARYAKAAGFARLALHAQVLGFEHPRSKKEMIFESKLPADLQQLLDRLKYYTQIINPA